jgi:hypothetical protein
MSCASIAAISTFPRRIPDRSCLYALEEVSDAVEQSEET